MASRERDVETVVLNLLEGVSALSGFTKHHHDRVGEVLPSQISVKASRGLLVLGGPGGFEYTVEVAIGQGIVKGEDPDDFLDAISEIDSELAAPTTDGSAGTYFDYFEIREDQASQKDIGSKEIRRVARYIIHASGTGNAFQHSLDFSTIDDESNSFYIPLI